MKTLSIWQPWASLIAHEHKRVETRDWGTNYRGPILIHASKRWTREEREDAALLWPGPLPGLPLGAVVAVARLAKCMCMTHGLVDAQTEQERAMGAWEPGRLFDVVPADLPPSDFAMLVTAYEAVQAVTRG
jgi:hypothetical protein